MRKIYVKPVANSVAFVVNENIATSNTSKDDIHGIVGSLSYDQVERGVCNDVINSTQIPTGLPEGVYDSELVFPNLTKPQLAEIVRLIYAGKFNCF